METLYRRALNFQNGNKNENDLNNVNFDTMNNNHGFPHRLVLPKGTVGGEDYTFFVIVSDLKNHQDSIQYRDNLNTFNLNRRDINQQNGQDSNESNNLNDSNDSNGHGSNGSNDSQGSNSNESDNHDDNNRLFNNRKGDRNNMNRKVNQKDNNRDWNNNMGRGNWEKNNGVMFHNLNNGNKNSGNGNGVLDNRAMGFPFDRQINDFNGFITKNMFFKDVTIYHNDKTSGQNY